MRQMILVGTENHIPQVWQVLSLPDLLLTEQQKLKTHAQISDLIKCYQNQEVS
jgi:hypothetical protein